MATTDPQEFARLVLDDIEITMAEAYDAVDAWDYDRLVRAFADIAEHVKSWQQGPIRGAAARSQGAKEE